MTLRTEFFKIMAPVDADQLPRAFANSSFPMPPHAPGSQKTSSVISSRMTEIASEDGDEYNSEGAGNTRRLAAGVITGRSPNEPTRPPSAMLSQTRPSTRSPPSRRGIPFSGGWRSGAAFGGPGGTVSSTSRPPSATSRTSRTSRTHVPSLASHAFFRPMSSQRLQAQRAGRPSHAGQSISSVDGYSDGGSNLNRRSLNSNMTAQQGIHTHHDDNDKRPPSRGTEFTDLDERGTINASPTGNATLQSTGGSERPLRDRSLNISPTTFNLGDNYKQHASGYPSTQRSPKSFGANFLVSSSGGVPTSNDNQGREHLSSSNIPTRSAQVDKSRKRIPEAGINYQYFSGNTVFCCGGRFQNTRDRPINFATGILVIVPSILFLSYS